MDGYFIYPFAEPINGPGKTSSCRWVDIKHLFRARARLQRFQLGNSKLRIHWLCRMRYGGHRFSPFQNANPDETPNRVLGSPRAADHRE